MMLTKKKDPGIVDRRLVAHSPDDGPIVTGVQSTRHADKSYICHPYPGYMTGDCSADQAPAKPFVYCSNCCCGMDMSLWVHLCDPVVDGNSITVTVEGSNDDFTTVATLATLTVSKAGDQYMNFSTCETDTNHEKVRINVTALTGNLNGWIYLHPGVC